MPSRPPPHPLDALLKSVPNSEANLNERPPVSTSVEGVAKQRGGPAIDPPWARLAESRRTSTNIQNMGDGHSGNICLSPRWDGVNEVSN
jgi:hypothetical protein